MLDDHLDRLLSMQRLSRTEAEEMMHEVLTDASPYQIAALLTLLKFRGETAGEIAGMVQAMRHHALPVEVPFPLMDIAGTGGDRAGTINISTGSSILAAACGIPVAKHGNRSVSSLCGAADVLEAFGVKIDMSPAQVEACIQKTGIAFMFAPSYHPHLQHIGPIRRGLQFPTALNIMMVLLNPAKASHGLFGVATETMLDLMAEVIVELGTPKRALVFHGQGLDELSPLGPIQARHIHNGKIQIMEIDPINHGFPKCTLEDLRGGDAIANAKTLKEVFLGRPGPIADALIFTTGYSLWIYGKVDNADEGIEIAREALRSGAAMIRLEQWIQFSHNLKETMEAL